MGIIDEFANHAPAVGGIRTAGVGGIDGVQPAVAIAVAHLVTVVDRAEPDGVYTGLRVEIDQSRGSGKRAVSCGGIEMDLRHDHIGEKIGCGDSVHAGSGGEQLHIAVGVDHGKNARVVDLVFPVIFGIGEGGNDKRDPSGALSHSGAEPSEQVAQSLANRRQRAALDEHFMNRQRNGHRVRHFVHFRRDRAPIFHRVGSRGRGIRGAVPQQYAQLPAVRQRIPHFHSEGIRQHGVQPCAILRRQARCFHGKLRDNRSFHVLCNHRHTSYLNW